MNRDFDFGPQGCKPYSKHLGYPIYRDEEGFYWANGGYCETLAEIEAEILDFCAEEEAHYRDIDTPADTPCLPYRYPY